MLEKTHKINSKNWWNDYFTHHWEKNNGCQQSAVFMQALIKAIPEQEKRWIEKQARNLVDWGCALGDGLPLLDSCFKPECLVGIDFSVVSLNKARVKFSDFNFYESWQDYSANHGLADVVFNSNCLEHFQEPFVYLQEGLKHSRFLYCILVPYKEREPICESHCQIFDENSFPQQFHGFTMIHQQIMAMDPMVWDGKQMLMIYASKDYLENRFR